MQTKNGKQADSRHKQWENLLDRCKNNQMRCLHAGTSVAFNMRNVHTYIRTKIKQFTQIPF